MKGFLVEMTNRVLATVGYRAVRYPKAIQADPSKELQISLMNAIGDLRLQATSEDSVFQFLQIGALELKGHFEPVATARKFPTIAAFLSTPSPLPLHV